VRGFVYWHPLIYRAAMKAVYGGCFEKRYALIAAEIPDGAQVDDFCCGDASLYFDYLRRRSIRYRGFDLNPVFVRWLRRRGVEACVFDLETDPVPSGQILVLQASLYQFIPGQRKILDKLFSSGHERIIIAEPVSNLSQSHSRLLRGLARLATATDKGARPDRFEREQLLDLFRQYSVSRVIDADRELIGIFER